MNFKICVLPLLLLGACDAVGQNIGMQSGRESRDARSEGGPTGKTEAHRLKTLESGKKTTLSVPVQNIQLRENNDRSSLNSIQAEKSAREAKQSARQAHKAADRAERATQSKATKEYGSGMSGARAKDPIDSDGGSPDPCKRSDPPSHCGK
jgi:hypothetical protein